VVAFAGKFGSKKLHRHSNKQYLGELVDKFDCKELPSCPSKLLGEAEVDRSDSKQPKYHPSIVYQVELGGNFRSKEL
jgi:hypothetical protein